MTLPNISDERRERHFRLMQALVVKRGLVFSGSLAEDAWKLLEEWEEFLRSKERELAGVVMEEE